MTAALEDTYGKYAGYAATPRGEVVIEAHTRCGLAVTVRLMPEDLAAITKAQAAAMASGILIEGTPGEPPDSCEGEGDSLGPVQGDAEHADDFAVRVDDWMFGPQDADLS